MATLKPAHAAAIARLRVYTPPPTHFYSLPLSRRAAVLILLYADRKGELRVVLTMRAKTLSSYAGQAALPGGKSDSLSESPSATARREAHEEIGLPLSDALLPRPFRIHQLCQLPLNLARTELGVRPCVAWIEADPLLMLRNEHDANATAAASEVRRRVRVPSVDEVLIPRLDAKEVAAVFTAPFEAFLASSFPDSLPSAAPNQPQASSSSAPLSSSSSSSATVEGDTDTSEWYTGQWIDWYAGQWRMHNFYVPSSEQRVAWAEQPPTTMTMNRFRVFGMTARILVDAARVAFAREPEFEHNSQFGDEELIGWLLREGRLGERVKREALATVDDDKRGPEVGGAKI